MTKDNIPKNSIIRGATIKALLFRTLVFTHRYLGIAIGWLMLMWCLSGLVMMYVAYPDLSPRERNAALSALKTTPCCAIPDTLFAPEQPIRTVSMIMLNTQPVLYAASAAGERRLVNLDTGQDVIITPSTALQIASHFVAAEQARVPSATPTVHQIMHDQWTVYPRYNPDRPLYHIALHDPAGTEVYVSSQSGEVVQQTIRTQRFWNWLGAVPHWLYFTAIRQQPALWNNLVITSSLAGCFLAGFGLYLGIRQLRRRHDGQLHSPYRHWKYWHHLTGLVFGVFVLSWVFSGLLSMQPWGWLESKPDPSAEQSLQGTMPAWSTIHAALTSLPTATLPTQTVRITSAMTDGKLHFNVVHRSQQDSQPTIRTTRLDAHWHAAPLALPDITHLAGNLHPQAQVTLLTQEDAFYYSRHSQPVSLPVWRIRLPDDTRYYLDASTGELLRRMDAGARGFRWLHLGLHRLDFTAWLRISPWRDVFMWSLLLGVTGVCATGTVLGVKRLRWQRRHHHTR